MAGKREEGGGGGLEEGWGGKRAEGERREEGTKVILTRSYSRRLYSRQSYLEGRTHGSRT